MSHQTRRGRNGNHRIPLRWETNRIDKEKEGNAKCKNGLPQKEKHWPGKNCENRLDTRRNASGKLKSLCPRRELLGGGTLRIMRQEPPEPPWDHHEGHLTSPRFWEKGWFPPSGRFRGRLRRCGRERKAAKCTKQQLQALDSLDTLFTKGRGGKMEKSFKRSGGAENLSLETTPAQDDRRP